MNHSADLKRFITQLYEIGRARKHDFIIIDTPGGVQHLNLVAHGMADTLITPVNDSFLDLDVLVAMERSDLEPYTPRWFGARLTQDATSVVVRPTGS